MEKICKNCKLHCKKTCHKGDIQDFVVYSLVIETAWDDTCDFFDPIQEDNKEER